MHVGVSSEERAVLQECLVDVELETDLQRASQSDQLKDSLDYSAVFQAVHDVAHEKRYRLLERFAGVLEERLRRDFSLDGVVLRVKKLNPPLDGPLEFAGVELRRKGSSASHHELG
jgi:dihydroneopterin aldolase